MADNRAIIPLYLNSDMVQNLFTIVVNEFIEAETKSTKEQVTINYRTPFSEFSYDLFGKYVQGEASVQIFKEFAQQRTEALISKDIDIFMNLRSILLRNNILRNVYIDEPFENIHENDFIVLECELLENPIYKYLENIIRVLEIKSCFEGDNNRVNTNFLNKIRGYFDDWRSNKNLSFYSKGICTPKANCIVPVENKHCLSNFEYITHGKVNVLGKITRIGENKNTSFLQSLNGNGFNFLQNSYFTKYITDNLGSELLDYNKELSSINNRNFEMFPLAIYF
jgi:hypothetical protein